MSVQRTIVSVSLNRESKAELNSLVIEEEKTQSEIIREAVRQYKLNKEWSRLRRIGTRIAIKMGIETDGDILKILNR